MFNLSDVLINRMINNQVVDVTANYNLTPISDILDTDNQVVINGLSITITRKTPRYHVVSYISLIGVKL